MKHYLIDSENVGDFWIPLLEIPADQAELIVFYTKNSPHMSYDSLIKLKESDRKVIFIKCYEGTNALDFQLCSELGYCIARNENDDFIIVTNDTGYDAAVKYWRHKEYSVKRIAGKDSRTGSRRRGNLARYDVAAEVSSILHKLVSAPVPGEAGPSAENGMEPEMMDEQTDLSGTGPDPVYGIESAEETDAVSESTGYEEDPDLTYEDDPDHEERIADDEEGLSEDEEDYVEEPEDETDHGEEPEDGTDYDEEPEDGTDSGEEPEEENDHDEEPEEEPEYGDEPEDGTDDASEYDPEDESDDDEPENDPDGDSDKEKADADSAGPAADGREEKETVPVTEDIFAEQDEEVFTPDTEELTAIVNCLGMDNLAELHNQLIQFYGDNGKDVYQSIKAGNLAFEKLDWSKEEKFLYYCALILRHSDEPQEALAEDNIREFAEFLLSAENKRKNLNSLRYALLKHYGKEKGRRYYFMLKPYVKALNQM